MRQLRTRQSRPSLPDRGAEDRQEGAEGAGQQEEIDALNNSGGEMVRAVIALGVYEGTGLHAI